LVAVAGLSSPAIVWFRDDLRLADNPALQAAVSSKHPLICLYIHDEESEGLRPRGGASKWWLQGAVAALNAALAARGGGLTLCRGAAAPIVEHLATDTKAAAVYWNRRYDEAGRAIDTKIKAVLKERGILVESFNAALLHEPWAVMNKAGAPFRVFSAYWRAACAQGDPEAPLAAPRKLVFHALPQKLRAKCVSLADLKLLPEKPDWAGGLRAAWVPGEEAAQKALARFLTSGLRGYATSRDRLDEIATSRLSPYLRFGHVSPRQIWHAAKHAVASGASKASGKDLEKFLSEIGWREFSYHLLFYNPDLATQNLQPRFDAMAWHGDMQALRAWQHGETGYPIVDAGMRELWTTGWLHNRLRMIVASFLAKHLLVDWREGEAWFWDTLVDADPANNAASWQWVAGSGADAAPYFRIFNPTLQGEKFDPDGSYVKRFVPELAGLPPNLIHKPWKGTAQQLAAADVVLGKTYPRPIVDHDLARRRALAGFKAISG
jgi:deoxyribodipyrimidine photo-lyase